MVENGRKDFLDQMDALFEDGQSYVALLKDMQKTIEPKAVKRQKTESSFVGKLLDFQEEGLGFLFNSWICGMNCILADEMGLGKTVQVIAFLAKLHDSGSLGRVIVMCPSAVVYNWVAEIERFAPNLPAFTYLGTKAERRSMLSEMPDASVLVTSYSIYMNDAGMLNRCRYSVCVVDEAHRLKNYKCKLSVLMEGLITDDRILLTGTPLQNDIIELWSLLKFCLPDIFDKNFQIFEAFMEELKANEKQSDLVFKMRKIIEPHLLRRTKQQVFPDMTKKESFLIFCPMTSFQKQLYTEAKKGETLIAAINKLVGPPESCPKDIKMALGRIRPGSQTLRELKLCCHPYLYLALELKHPVSLMEASGKFCVLFQLLTHLLATTKDKVIIFTQFVDIIAFIEMECQDRDIKTVSFSGSTNLEKREEQIEQFKNDSKTRVFVATTRSGGMGLNLTAANHVILYDLDWSTMLTQEPSNG